MTGQFLNEPHGHHILGSGSLDADIPHAVDLCNRDEEHGAESTLQRKSEGPELRDACSLKQGQFRQYLYQSRDLI